MTRATSASLQNSEFNTFLFAPIGDDRNGMSLSVLSALARLDVDPWHEADALDRMPTAKATQRMTSLIGALPDMAASHLDTASIASRLIALLPHRNGGLALPPAAVARLDPRARSGLLLGALTVAFILGALLVLMAR